MAACVSLPVQKRGTIGLTPLRSPESLLAGRRINVCWRSAVKTQSTRIRCSGSKFGSDCRDCLNAQRPAKNADDVVETLCEK